MNIALLCLLAAGQVASEERTAIQEFASTTWGRAYSDDTLARRGFIAKSYLTLQPDGADCKRGSCWYLSAMTWRDGRVDLTAWHGKFWLLKADDEQLFITFVMHYRYDAVVKKSESKMSRWTRTNLQPLEMTDIWVPMVGAGYLSKTPVVYVARNSTLNAETAAVTPEPFDISFFARKSDSPMLLEPASSFAAVFLDTPPPNFKPEFLTKNDGERPNQQAARRRR